MGHHTKDRGDQGVAFVTADLMSFDIIVTRPLSEHTPFDLVVLSPDCQRVCRLSVKYRSVNPIGCVTVPLKSVWSDGNGRHVVVHDKSTYDAIAIYCPETHECYYVRLNEIPGVQVSLRVHPPRNNQQAHVRVASEFRDPMRLFGKTLGMPKGSPIGITAALPRRPRAPPEPV
jgi:hypothetical protein